MIDLALDTNAAVDFIRDDRQSPPQINAAERVVVPLTVIGELYFGAARSDQPEANRSIIKSALERWDPLLPDVETARIYGEIRAATFHKTGNLSTSRVNDLWIAALCIQHKLPLLTNDAGFDRIHGLTVIHW